MFTKTDYSKRLPDFPLYKQETDHTCGPASIRMILKYLGVEESESNLARRCFTNPIGTLHYPVLWGFNHYLKKLHLKAKMVQNDPAVYERIKEALENNCPVLFIYSTIDAFHPPTKCSHYSVIIGLDESSEIIFVANPFGEIQEVALDEWWAKFSHDPEHESTLTRRLVKLRLLKPRTAFLISSTK